MKKIAVIGCPGSGKSTFSRVLHDVTGIPLFHLDMMYWNADRTTADKTVFRERLFEVIKKDQWIIDGNFGRTLEMRIKAGDTIFLLDFPKEVCLQGVMERVGKVREDMPWVEERFDEEFRAFIEGFAEKELPRIYSFLDNYKDKNIIIFKDRNALNEYINSL